MQSTRIDPATLSHIREFNSELISLGKLASSDIKVWARSSSPNRTALEFIRKGAYFSRIPIRSARDSGYKDFFASRELRSAILSLLNFTCTSHNAKEAFFESPYEDVFLNGSASVALSRIFHRKGWSAHVWKSKLVEYSSFRAAIGMALVIYGIYIHKSVQKGDIASAVAQSADAGLLLALDLEMKNSIKFKEVKVILTEAIARASKDKASKVRGGKARQEPYAQDKARTKTLYIDWQVELKTKPVEMTWKNKSEFGRYALKNCCKEVKSLTTITRTWCPEWESDSSVQDSIRQKLQSAS